MNATSRSVEKLCFPCPALVSFHETVKCQAPLMATFDFIHSIRPVWPVGVISPNQPDIGAYSALTCVATELYVANV